MRLLRKAALVLAAGAVALSLGGCISLFPKAKPAQLYRFGATVPPAAAAPRQTVVVKGIVDFEEAAATDRILTSDGDTVAYIAGARWVSSAPVLFDEALDRTFQNTPSAPLLVRRSRALADALVLTLDVSTFETRYTGGAEPTVVIELKAALIRPATRETAAEKVFRIERPASENRVSAIVQAYDAAVTQVLSDLAAWTSQYAA
jgi:cholesterol transport system auxiliary component